MLVHSQIRPAHELLRWVALVLLAAALVLGLASVATGTPWEKEADELPFPAARPLASLQPPSPVTDEHIATMQLWMAVLACRDTDPATADEVWRTVPLPQDVEIWRQVTRAALALQMGERARAADHLEAAIERNPHHALAHYYLGCLRMQDAERLRTESLDDVLSDVRIVGHPRVAAIHHFQACLATAHWVDPTEPLLPVSWGMPEPMESAMPVVPPRVGDWLEALELTRFEGLALRNLGVLCTEEDWLFLAELHLDQARSFGVAVEREYRDIGRAYERNGDTVSAERLYRKALLNVDSIILEY